MEKKLIIVRGGGDLATGTIHRLWSSGFPVLVLETENPAAIRRQVAVSEAIYEGKTVIEGMSGIRIDNCDQAQDIIDRGEVPVLVDPKGTSIQKLHPAVVVDAILAKKNLGMKKNLAPLTVALGSGFEAGKDVDIVIETMRGHNLGRIIRSGCAAANTGIPAIIGGYGRERVIHAPEAGMLHHVCKIGDMVSAGEKIAQIEREDKRLCPVCVEISGVLRGLLREGYLVHQGMKIADIDPRKEEKENCFTISDKARCIAGSVLEVVVSSILW